MPYPTVSHKNASIWYQAWEKSGDADIPREFPKHDMSKEKSNYDWFSIAKNLMDDLNDLFDNSHYTNKYNIKFFDAEASIKIHQSLPRDIALTDPEFWIWMATNPGMEFICRRYFVEEKDKIPFRGAFTSYRAEKNFFYRIWQQAEHAFDPKREDPYELVHYGDIYFWMNQLPSHMAMESTAFLSAYLRFLYPDGPKEESRIRGQDIKNKWIQYIRRASANIMTEILDEKEAIEFIEEQWNKIKNEQVETDIIDSVEYDIEGLSVPYKPCDYFTGSKKVSPEYYEIPVLAMMVERIIEHEGPIHEEFLAERMKDMIFEEGSNQKDVHDVSGQAIIKSCESRNIIKDNAFIMTEAQKTNPIVRNRQGMNISREYLPPIEIFAASQKIKEKHPTIKENELISSIARLFGFDSSDKNLLEIIKIHAL